MTRLTLLLAFLAAGLASADEPELVCGEGPHTLAVTIMVPCPQPEPVPYRDEYGNYQYGPTVILSIACWDTVYETWTDWPECGGSRTTRGTIEVTP